MNCMKKHLRMLLSLKDVIFLLEKLNKLQVKKGIICLLIMMLIVKLKMRNSLEKEGKLGCQHCKRSQETLRIIQTFLADFRFLFYKGQYMVLLIGKLDKCSLVYLDPCVHMAWCGLCSSLHTSYCKNYKVGNKRKIERK